VRFVEPGGDIAAAAAGTAHPFSSRSRDELIRD
jgi:hypothetical protein